MSTGANRGNRRWRRKEQATAKLPALLDEVVLRSPPVLNFGAPSEINALYEFFREIRINVLGFGRRVVIDLRSCQSLGPVGVLLLAAEIERCNYVRPDYVTGYSPLDPVARKNLAIFGFYKAVGLEHDVEAFGPEPNIVQIASGIIGKSGAVASSLGRVAALTFDMWGDQGFTDRIHGALNEAMTNVLMHAYDPDLMAGTEACESGRWWVAGFSSPTQSHAWFMALDLGVGIPTSAPIKNKGLNVLLAKPERPTDAAIIKLMVDDEERSRTGLPQHGKGMPTMVSLVRDRVDEGTVWIVSGRGCYVLDKNGARPHELRVLNYIIQMTSQASGTLILWKVGRPMTSSGIGE